MKHYLYLIVPAGPIKKHLVLANSVGVIDSDYYSNESNDGEILVCMYNFSKDDLIINKGERIAQAMFQKVLITDDDVVSNGLRNGGFGSTN